MITNTTFLSDKGPLSCEHWNHLWVY